MINDKYYNRHYVVGGIAIVIVLIYVIRLFYLQIIDQSTLDKAESNALVRQTIYPSRGLIYDRNDSLLVYNQPVYEVMLIVKEMNKKDKLCFDTLSFCRALDITPTEFQDRMDYITDRKKNRGYSPYTPQVFLSQLSKEDISTIRQSLFHFPGVSIRERTLRDYTCSAAAHILGSVGEVNQRDLESDPYYQIGDYSGRDGVERQYESVLRGQKGVEVLMRDSRGRIQGSYHEGELDLSPIAGDNLTLSIDIRLQRMAEALLRGKIGSVVAIEPSSGEVLAMVSSPSWDPKTLVGRQRGANYQRLQNDPHKPLMNRAVQAQYPPGSTFKLLQALICLDEGAITPRTLYPCNGPTSQPIKCTHHHGSPVALEGAIEQSCNPYFWQAFRDLLQKNGYGKKNEQFRTMYERWREHILRFGLGQRFEDSDIPNQASGSIPSTAFYDRYYGKTGWKAITIRSLSIGQGEILETPLQLANQAACIANNGYYITPHLLHNDSTYSYGGATTHYTHIDTTWYAVVKHGMQRVMTYGTGRHYAVEALHMCGKTGTAQNPHGKDHAIFMGFAPMEEPKIAIAVIVENAGFGATWACPVATLMMEQYLTDSISNQDLYDRLSTTQLITP